MAISTCQAVTHRQAVSHTHGSVPTSPSHPQSQPFIPLSYAIDTGCHGYLPTSTHMHITQPLQFIPFVTHGWTSYSYDHREGNGARQRERGVRGYGGRMEGWWSSVWLSLAGCNWCPLFQKPCSDGGQDDSRRISPAIHSVCMNKWMHTHFEGIQLVTDTDNVP